MNHTRFVETDALGALRDELTRAARRRASRRIRARRRTATVALAAGLLGVTGAAVALTGSGTGVPAVDELLAIEKIGGQAGLPTGDATEPITVRIGDGTYEMVAYRTRGDQVRIAFAEPHDGGVRGGGGGGWTAAELTRRLERRGTDVQGWSSGFEQRVFYGYADGAVQFVRVKAEGNWRVKLSEPWTPQAPGARPLRLLVVIDDRDLGAEVEPHPRTQHPPELEPVYRR